MTSSIISSSTQKSLSDAPSSSSLPINYILPKEIILHIFSFLNEKNLMIANLVCRKWSQLSTYPLIWKKFLPPQLNHLTSLPKDWRAIYKNNYRILNHVKQCLYQPTSLAMPTFQGKITSLLSKYGFLFLGSDQGFIAIYQADTMHLLHIFKVASNSQIRAIEATETNLYLGISQTLDRAVKHAIQVWKIEKYPNQKFVFEPTSKTISSDNLITSIQVQEHYPYLYVQCHCKILTIYDKNSGQVKSSYTHINAFCFHQHYLYLCELSPSLIPHLRVVDLASQKTMFGPISLQDRNNTRILLYELHALYIKDQSQLLDDIDQKSQGQSDLDSSISNQEKSLVLVVLNGAGQHYYKLSDLGLPLSNKEKSYLAPTCSFPFPKTEYGWDTPKNHVLYLNKAFTFRRNFFSGSKTICLSNSIPGFCPKFSHLSLSSDRHMNHFNDSHYYSRLDFADQKIFVLEGSSSPGKLTSSSFNYYDYHAGKRLWRAIKQIEFLGTASFFAYIATLMKTCLKVAALIGLLGLSVYLCFAQGQLCLVLLGWSLSPNIKRLISLDELKNILTISKLALAILCLPLAFLFPKVAFFHHIVHEALKSYQEWRLKKVHLKYAKEMRKAAELSPHSARLISKGYPCCPISKEAIRFPVELEGVIYERAYIAQVIAASGSAPGRRKFYSLRDLKLNVNLHQKIEKELKLMQAQA